MPQVDPQVVQVGPSLEGICALYRSIINDDFSGSGQINTDTAPWMVPYLNSAIEDVYQELGIIGDLRLIKEAIIEGIPAVTGIDPSVQVGVTYTGVVVQGSSTSANFAVDAPTLPPDMLYLRKLWQRPNGATCQFRPMFVAPDGLHSLYQGMWMGEYDVRGNNEIWMSGALVPIDLRLRYDAAWQYIVADEVDFATSYVPLIGSMNAIAHKMVSNYAQRLSPDQFALADSRAESFMKKLKVKSVLNSQTKQFSREPFAGDCQ